MKRDLIISYENINEYKLIELTAENIETFTIPIEYVLDINLLCDKKDGYYKNEFFSDEGFIKFSEKVKNLLSNDYEFYKKNFLEEDAEFYNRISKYLDICHITLVKHDNRKVHIGIPYGPVESVFAGVIELSNCHSLELDQVGNVVLKYGNLSTIPKGNDLYIEQIVENWKEYFEDIKSNYIVINLERFYYKEIEGKVTIRISADLIIGKNKCSPARFVFEGVKDFEEDTDYQGDSLTLYKLLDGSYFAMIGFMSEFKFERCYLEKIYLY